MAMKKFTLLILVLFLLSFFFPLRSRAAFGTPTNSVRFAVNVGNEVAATSDTFTLTNINGNANAGDLALLAVVMDNLGTTDGQTSQLTSVSDSKSNTWTKAGEFTNTGGGSAADGATIAVWYSVLTTTIVGGTDTITLNYSGSLTDKGLQLQTITIGAGSTISLAGTLQTLANDNSDVGSMSYSGLTSKEYLFYRAFASETPSNDGNGNGTPTTNYTQLTGSNTGSGGSEKGHMSGWAEERVLTGTGDTSDPTLVDTTSDNASLYIAFQENAAVPSAGKVLNNKPLIIFKGKTIIKGGVKFK